MIEAVGRATEPMPVGENPRLNLAREFATLAAPRPADTIQVVAHHEKGGPAHRYQSLTFGRCRELGEQYARGLQASNIRQGDLAVILMKPSLELVPVFLALWHVGAIPLVVDPGASKEQKLKSIEDIRPNVLVGIPLVHALRILHRKAFRSITRSVTIGGFSPVGGPTLKSFLRLPSLPKDEPFPSAPTLANDTMAIVFTTGSTGAPKGVVYTHANGAAIIQIMQESLGIGPQQICLACHPAFAIYFVGSGATVITPDMDPRYPRDADPACLFDIIREQKPTVAFMQIPVVRNLVKYCTERGEKIPHLRKILTTGASVPIELVEGVQR
ncbi:AMP-binding protein, partial [Pseudomonas sp.]|uniref:AMP-binding protein n=1 Tax=Pseudomonas sp. TaxID=306 RepID=UPI003C66CA61